MCNGAASVVQAGELEALVSKALVAALAEEQYTRGVVIDSLTSQYLSPDLAANLLLSSMGLQKICKSVHRRPSAI